MHNFCVSDVSPNGLLCTAKEPFRLFSYGNNSTQTFWNLLGQWGPEKGKKGQITLFVCKVCCSTPKLAALTNKLNAHILLGVKLWFPAKRQEGWRLMERFGFDILLVRQHVSVHLKLFFYYAYMTIFLAWIKPIWTGSTILRSIVHISGSSGVRELLCAVPWLQCAGLTRSHDWAVNNRPVPKYISNINAYHKQIWKIFVEHTFNVLGVFWDTEIDHSPYI